MGFGFILTILIVSSKEQTLSPKRVFRAIFRKNQDLGNMKMQLILYKKLGFQTFLLEILTSGGDTQI